MKRPSQYNRCLRGANQAMVCRRGPTVEPGKPAPRGERALAGYFGAVSQYDDAFAETESGMAPAINTIPDTVS